MSTALTFRQHDCFQEAGNLIEETGGASSLPVAPDAFLRFEDTFWGVFSELPPFARRVLRDHWEGWSLDTLSGETAAAPSIEITSDPSGRKAERVLAATNSLFFRFNPLLVQAAPPDVIRAVIVHELAHSYVQASGWDLGTEAEEEQVIPTIMRAWGDYRDDTIDFWAREKLLLADRF